ncbi:response regulator with CheY-like receiver, AAA-type ATPase, and DNA-binding domains [Belliella baltica DSM 15883]|uniref:Response regulator with CheY-like receiver, AAA-type ATPase, and DNA-binding domains n=1 Tax=Belliella baltica (strain DSM 15883 / CIP 108006 / LMG 21964 / BA134) TaxID=866536 RepID=I3Z6P2_BELBD|nr:response regulator [Belliella baltica]AFL84910.1 response regulator with CheY-like receiver, AAA-type ATPase, and DNA-binding domains [Belliella baltica DSM 15883]
MENISKIIFVDDDKIQHMINKKNMIRIKPELELIFFSDPFLALDWLETNSADLLLLDINMPEMSGWEFLERLASKKININVNMLSSSMDPDDYAKSKEFESVSGFLIKPLQIDVIEQLLNQ